MSTELWPEPGETWAYAGQEWEVTGVPPTPGPTGSGWATLSRDRCPVTVFIPHLLLFGERTELAPAVDRYRQLAPAPVPIA